MYVCKIYPLSIFEMILNKGLFFCRGLVCIFKKGLCMVNLEKFWALKLISRIRIFWRCIFVFDPFYGVSELGIWAA
jgi:hypothetical protein